MTSAASIKVRALAGPIRIIRREQPVVVPIEVERRVDALWTQAKKQRGDALFNGRVFALRHWPATQTIDTIEGDFVEYRYLMAQRAAPELASVLALRPLAVSGVLVCRQDNAPALVFGRRGACVAEDVGFWELAPAGGLDPSAETTPGRVDPVHQLCIELEEELGISSGHAAGARPICLVEDNAHQLVEIAIVLETDLERRGVEAAFARRRTNEYSAIAIVPVTELSDFLAQWKSETTAASLGIVDFWRREQSREV